MYRVLIVGAGAVGQVYGHFMQRGGASVSFLVKEKYQEACEKGFSLYRSRRSGLGPREYYQADHIYTDYEDVAQQQFDHVWLAMSSNDLRGEWLSELREAIGDTTLVMLQPDLEDRDYVLKYFPESQLVYGIINFISYQTPLPDLPSHHPDADKEGVAYLMLPMMSAEFSGHHERLPAVMEALSAGRFPVRAQQNVPRIYADRSAWMIPLVAVLELENWSIKRLLRSGSLDLAVEGARQALAIVAAKFHRPLNWTERGFSLVLVKVLLPVVRFLSPMDAESFIKFQFRKTAPQTRFMLDHFIHQGESRGMNVTALKTLREKLPETGKVEEAA
ncbi:MAG: 2-dehydropantoate 2-reductase N-terminal domain-containing protein [Ketobacteraceae bacterium]|nr:2-dehydropantoate 2-reductase N-terminal domain-containing protein [Ketobacteraceae bacterium]